MDTSVGSSARLGVYLYCLSTPSCVEALRPGRPGAVLGVDERYPVDVLERSGVAAVIGTIDPADFTDENLQALAWLGPRAMRHDAIVQQVMDAGPVLPVKFGTIFGNAAALESLLATHHDRIAGVLEELAGRAEWSVKAYASDSAVRESVAALDPEIQRRLAELSPAPGMRYLQRKQLDPLIDAAAQEWIADRADGIQDELAARAVATATLRCHSTRVTGRSDRMIMNSSYLLSSDAAAMADFQAALEAQSRACTGYGVTLELKGPWPPYNFCPPLPVAGE